MSLFYIEYIVTFSEPVVLGVNILSPTGTKIWETATVDSNVYYDTYPV